MSKGTILLLLLHSNDIIFNISKISILYLAGLHHYLHSLDNCHINHILVESNLYREISKIPSQKSLDKSQNSQVVYISKYNMLCNFCFEYFVNYLTKQLNYFQINSY